MRLGLFEQAPDRLLPQSPSITFVSPLAADGRVLFPTRWRPLAADVLNRVAWQIERRAGSPVFLDLPSAWLAESALLADLARYVNFAGVRLPTFPGDALAERALTSLARWCWPLRVAYAPPALPTPEQWARLRAGDLVVLPASPENMAAVPLTEKARVLFDFDPQGMPGVEIDAQMRCLEADGFRQFGLRGFPDAGFEAVWRLLSLRSQPLLP